MFKILLLIAITLFLSSCSESPKKQKITINLDSLIYDKKGEPLTGIMKGDFRGKKIEFEVVDGFKHGMFRTYYENGNLEMEGFINQNKNDSLWKYYYPEGQIESEGYFVNDKADGKWVWYYPSGKVRERAEYKKAKRNGKLIMYDEDGKIVSEKIFNDGIEVTSE